MLEKAPLEATRARAGPRLPGRLLSVRGAVRIFRVVVAVTLALFLYSEWGVAAVGVAFVLALGVDLVVRRRAQAR